MARSNGQKYMPALLNKDSIHCVVTRLSARGQPARQILDLLAQLIHSLRPCGVYALIENREPGMSEIWCGFSTREDVEAFAEAVDAKSLAADGWASRRRLILDDKRLARIACAAPLPGIKRLSKKIKHASPQ